MQYGLLRNRLSQSLDSQKQAVSQELSLGGSDDYANLVIVSDDVHRLIHASAAETLADYLRLLALEKPMIAKVNRLREKLNLSQIL
ncbi:protein of unknown function [Pseudodesulfovibrio profundus]|uniref:Uncharacterized protein n=1 Tax=Pseudodesulfovibrio profundus TaxID=57320 RepID=A0A2C8FAR4_9BACT|nr:protein of unknown function [Pseudodesulfovibrio profundus]